MQQVCIYVYLCVYAYFIVIARAIEFCMGSCLQGFAYLDQWRPKKIKKHQWRMGSCLRGFAYLGAIDVAALFFEFMHIVRGLAIPACDEVLVFRATTANVNGDDVGADPLRLVRASVFAVP